MLKVERLVLELLEYKVNDMLSRREPKGGASSAWSLYEYLLKESSLLSAEERRRFEDASQVLKRLSEMPAKARQAVQSFDQLELGGMSTTGGTASFGAPMQATFLSPTERDEQATLKRLAQRVWWSDMERMVQRLAANCRAERERHTPRLLYALLRNLAHHAKSTRFATDTELANFTVTQPVPELADPLLALNDVDSVVELIREVIETALTFKETGSPYVNLEVAENEGLAYLRRMALAVARDPYAGKMSLAPDKGTGSQQLRLALRELEREPMREALRRAKRRNLEERLQTALAHERTQRQLFERDVEGYAQAATAFFEQLAAYLPERVGGRASEPQLHGGVLFAENPALRLEVVPTDVSSLTVRLKGPVHFKFSGIAMAIVGSEPNWSLFVEGQTHPLTPEMKLEVGQRHMLVFREGAYVHVKLQREARSLAALVAEGLLAHHVLSSSHWRELLSVLKTATGVSVGEPQEMIRQAFARLSQMSAKAPDRRRAIEGFVLGSARALSLTLPEDVTAMLVQRLDAAMTVGADDRPADLEGADKAQTATYQLTDEPLSLQFDGQPLTIRRYAKRGVGTAENVVVMLPGRPLGSFTDYLLASLGNGALLCVKAEDELAVLYFAGAPVLV